MATTTTTGSSSRTSASRTNRKKRAAKKSSSQIPASKKNTQKKPASRKWSGKVTASSNAMDLEEHIFGSKSAKHIAESVKRSAEKSKRRKGTAYQSAMSMLNFYLNRAGKNLPARQKQTVEKAKEELRKLFGKP